MFVSFIDIGVNLALGKPTTQSSTGYGGLSSKAVDGNSNGQWGGGSCSHTYEDSPAWWEVDLGFEGPIKKVRVITSFLYI